MSSIRDKSHLTTVTLPIVCYADLTFYAALMQTYIL